MEFGNPVPAHVIVTHNGLEWVWASPCLQGGCTPGINVGLDRFVYATPAQWALRPRPEAFIGRCAAPWFDQTHDHCDLSDWVVSAPFILGQNRLTWDTMLVRIILVEGPDADAGEDQTVEWSATDNGAVTLDGTASSDPVGDGLTYSWSIQGAPIASGSTPTVILALGSHTVTLTVSSLSGGSDSDSVVIDVVDTTAPVVTAELVSVAGKSLKHNKGLFTVEFACADDCDPDASVTIAKLNGIPVENGQVVELRLKSQKSAKSGKSSKSKKSNKSKKSRKNEKSKRGGKSEKPVTIEGSSFELLVECVDASDNVGSATAAPVFAAKSKKSRRGSAAYTDG